MKIEKKHRRKARIEMIPLIDVIFLLLVTFILFSMSMKVHKVLPVVLPSASTAQIETKKTIDITVCENGSIFVERKKIETVKLAGLLKEYRIKSPDRAVMISGHKKASYESVAAVLEATGKAGIKEVSLEMKWE
ncbi:MAG: biopolymer transporter ExbD [Desulforhabdus sp.]|jgi:biopolymer transport protein ExbD|nr:biopolymer transporter ExbD [Desulforhabdus sp.]